jgi:hypothetical protein
MGKFYRCKPIKSRCFLVASSLPRRCGMDTTKGVDIERLKAARICFSISPEIRGRPHCLPSAFARLRPAPKHAALALVAAAHGATSGAETQSLAAGLDPLCGARIPPMKMPRATTTLGDLHRATPWLWLNCERCQHHAPLACAVAVIRWAVPRRATCCGSGRGRNASWNFCHTLSRSSGWNRCLIVSWLGRPCSGSSA